MRDLTELDKYRVKSDRVLKWYGSYGDHECGVFEIPSRSNGRKLWIIAAVGDGWEHVSVSLPKRPPSWAEMEQVKRLFFKEDEIAMQLHVKPQDHISVHDNCLHIWRPIAESIPLPPKYMVA